MQNLNVLGTEIVVDGKNGVTWFEKPGVEKFEERVTLDDFHKVVGFLNAASYVLDGKYPVLKHGIHGKFPLDKIAFYTEELDAFYVNFDMLAYYGDTATINFLASQNIVKREPGWLVLKIQNARLFPQGIVNPVLDDQLKELAQLTKMEKEYAAGNEHPAIPEISDTEMIYWRLNNTKAWNQLNLHQGIEDVMCVAEGTKRVALAYFPKRELDQSKLNIVERKLNALFASAEVRAEITDEGRENAKAYRTQKVAEFRVAHRPASPVAQAAEEVVRTGVMYWDGCTEKAGGAQDLVRTKVQYLVGNDPTTPRPVAVTIANLNAAKAALGFAKTHKFGIQVLARF